MGIRFFEPWEDLRDVVARIYVRESDALPMADHRWLIVPDGDIKLIFFFRGDIACTIGDIQRVHGVARIIVSGMRTLPGHLDFSQDLGAVGVIVRPEAAYRLLGVPQHEIANRTFDAEEILGGAVRQWHEALTNVTSTEGRVNGIQAALRDWLKGRDRRDSCLEYAGDHPRTHRSSRCGPIDIAAVCSGIQKTWSRPDAAQWAEAYSASFPPYQLLIESYWKAQDVVTQHEQLDSVLA